MELLSQILNLIALISGILLVLLVFAHELVDEDRFYAILLSLIFAAGVCVVSDLLISILYFQDTHKCASIADDYRKVNY